MRGEVSTFLRQSPGSDSGQMGPVVRRGRWPGGSGGPVVRRFTFLIHFVESDSNDARSVRSKQMMAARAPRQ